MGLGAFHGMQIGPPSQALSNHHGGGGSNEAAVATLDYGVAFRFKAPKGKVPVGIRTRFRRVDSATAFTIRIETADGSTPSKPSGTLYDVNAVGTGFSPTVDGIDGTLYSFPSAPTNPLVPGTTYFVVFITTSAGSNVFQLTSCLQQISMARLPFSVLYTTTAGTRTSFAESSNQIPVFAIRYSDGTEDCQALGSYGWAGSAVSATSFGADNHAVYQNRAAGAIFTVPQGQCWKILGLNALVNVWNTPTVGPRVRILDAANTLVPNASMSISLADAMNFGARHGWAQFPEPVYLYPGTYRAVYDAPGEGAGNGWNVLYAGYFTGHCPENFRKTSTDDLTASPVVWTESSNNVGACALVLDDIIVLDNPRTRTMKLPRL